MVVFLTFFTNIVLLACFLGMSVGLLAARGPRNFMSAALLLGMLALGAAVARTTATHGGALLSVGASAGTAALMPLDRPLDVLERADRAMYARKGLRNGRTAAERSVFAAARPLDAGF